MDAILSSLWDNSVPSFISHCQLSCDKHNRLLGVGKLNPFISVCFYNYLGNYLIAALNHPHRLYINLATIPDNFDYTNVKTYTTISTDLEDHLSTSRICFQYISINAYHLKMVFQISYFFILSPQDKYIGNSRLVCIVYFAGSCNGN